jgi:uncharacterized protein (DUF58 family)
MIPKEVLKKVRQIHIRTSKLVNELFAGEYVSTFRGRGIEFQEVREYQPGDDVTAIDWNVTARMGHPFIKQFVEEREMTVMLVVDASGSGRFGSGKILKKEQAAELAAVLAFSAIRNNDKVGLIIFSDEVEKYVPPKKGLRNVLRVIREILYFQPKRRETNIARAIEFLSSVTKRRTVTFLISDFISPDFEKPLRIVARRHDLIAVQVTDPREWEMPSIGFLTLEDSENGRLCSVNTWDKRLREAYRVEGLSRLEKDEKYFRSCGVDRILIRTDQPYVIPVERFFRLRGKRRATRG